MHRSTENNDRSWDFEIETRRCLKRSIHLFISYKERQKYHTLRLFDKTNDKCILWSSENSTSQLLIIIILNQPTASKIKLTFTRYCKKIWLLKKIQKWKVRWNPPERVKKSKQGRTRKRIKTVPYFHTFINFIFYPFILLSSFCMALLVVFWVRVTPPPSQHRVLNSKIIVSIKTI